MISSSNAGKQTGADDTAEPDGQFPDNDPAVGTIKAPPAEDPIPVRDPRPDDGRPGEDQNTHGDAADKS